MNGKSLRKSLIKDGIGRLERPFNLFGKEIYIWNHEVNELKSFLFSKSIQLIIFEKFLIIFEIFCMECKFEDF